MANGKYRKIQIITILCDGMSQGEVVLQPAEIAKEEWTARTEKQEREACKLGSEAGIHSDRPDSSVVFCDAAVLQLCRRLYKRAYNLSKKWDSRASCASRRSTTGRGQTAIGREAPAVARWSGFMF
jgi:hypothetical protein